MWLKEQVDAYKKQKKKHRTKQNIIKERYKKVATKSGLKLVKPVYLGYIPK